MKKINCADVVPGCDFHAEAETENELLQKAAKHAADAHGINEIPPELLTKVKSVIRSEE